MVGSTPYERLRQTQSHLAPLPKLRAELSFTQPAKQIGPPRGKVKEACDIVNDLYRRGHVEEAARGAARIFIAAARRPSTPSEVAFLTQAEQATLSIKSTVTGQSAVIRAYTWLHPSPLAPTVIVGHGYGGSTAVLTPAVQALRREYTVVAFDAPGHGASNGPPMDFSLWAPAWTMLIDYCARQGRVIKALVAHSAGALTAAFAAVQYKDYLQSQQVKLVLISPGSTQHVVYLLWLASMQLPAGLATPMTDILNQEGHIAPDAIIPPALGQGLVGIETLIVQEESDIICRPNTELYRPLWETGWGKHVILPKSSKLGHFKTVNNLNVLEIATSFIENRSCAYF